MSTPQQQQQQSNNDVDPLHYIQEIYAQRIEFKSGIKRNLDAIMNDMQQERKVLMKAYEETLKEEMDALVANYLLLANKTIDDECDRMDRMIYKLSKTQTQVSNNSHLVSEIHLSDNGAENADVEDTISIITDATEIVTTPIVHMDTKSTITEPQRPVKPETTVHDYSYDHALNMTNILTQPLPMDEYMLEQFNEKLKRRPMTDAIRSTFIPMDTNANAITINTKMANKMSPLCTVNTLYNC
jgi:hypothetical protein